MEEKQITLTQNKLKEIMWDKVGIIRTTKNLGSALKEIKKLEAKFKNNFKNKLNRKIIETGNMLLVSKLIIKSSLDRKESIEAFYIRN